MPTDNGNKSARLSLYDLTPPELESFFLSIGEEAYRARQVLDFLYRHPVRSFDEMTTLAKELREKLDETAKLAPLVLRAVAESPDGAVKHAYEAEELSDRGAFIESVWMPSEPADVGPFGEGRVSRRTDTDKHTRSGPRHTLCVSSQLGCSVGCTFCATGEMGLRGQLRSGEIVYQVVHCLELHGKLPDAVLFMGMGEPMHNFDSVCGAVEILTHEDALAMSPRRIVVSTAGELERLGAFHRRFPRVRLAISLNAATDSIRSKLMPINEQYGVKAIEAFVKSIDLGPGERITFEYVMIAGLTDLPSQVNALEALVVGLGKRARVNLIPYNEMDRRKFRQSSRSTIYAVQRGLRNLGVTAFIRRNRGAGASAACGQLAGRL
jgi:23S rRNA (adenine2503-C2)-methyltransferase